METKTKERPILFSGAMVRAVLNGKSQTRRVVKPQPPYLCRYEINGAQSHALCIGGDNLFVPPTPTSFDHRIACPYGQPGDRLWVREAWGLRAAENRAPFEIYEVLRGEYDLLRRDVAFTVQYRADREDSEMRWRPSIHMPRKLSRITLEITAVRCERLQDISDSDVRAEGMECPQHDFASGMCVGYCKALREKFAETWDALNKSRGYSWQSNPWTWALSFKRISP